MTAIAMGNLVGYSFALSKGTGVSDEAEQLHKALAEARLQRRNSVVLGWRDVITDSVSQLLDECSDVGWDGYDAVPVNRMSARNCALLAGLLPEGLTEPEVVPEPNGNIGLLWRNDLKISLILSVGEAGIDYAQVVQGKTRTTGSILFANEISQDILDILTRYFMLARSAA